MVKQRLFLCLLTLSSSIFAAEQKLGPFAAMQFNLSPSCFSSNRQTKADYSGAIKDLETANHPDENNFFTNALRTNQPAVRAGLQRVGIGGVGLAVSLIVQKILNRAMRARLRKQQASTGLYVGKKVADLAQMLSQFLFFGGLAHSGYHKWYDTEWRARMYDKGGKLRCPYTKKNGLEVATTYDFSNINKSIARGGFDWDTLYAKNKKIGSTGNALNAASWGTVAALHVALIALELKRIKHEKKLVKKYNRLPESDELAALIKNAAFSPEERKDYHLYAQYKRGEGVLRWLIGILQTTGALGVGIQARFLPMMYANPNHSPDGIEPKDDPRWLFSQQDRLNRLIPYGSSGAIPEFGAKKRNRWWAVLLSKPSTEQVKEFSQGD